MEIAAAVIGVISAIAKIGGEWLSGITTPAEAISRMRDQIAALEAFIGDGGTMDRALAKKDAEVDARLKAAEKPEIDDAFDKSLLDEETKP